MKSARMGRLDGLMRGLNKALFPLSSPRNLVGDLSLCRRITRTNNRFPTTTFRNDGHDNHDNHDNNRSWTTTFQDDGNNYYTASRGFTLIELLVVVLIIGILASYAVPSYRVAVGTSRAATMYALMHTIDEAQQLYLMRTNHYSANLNSLVIAMPAGFRKVNASEISTDNMRCIIVSFNENHHSSIRCWDLKTDVSLEKYHDSTEWLCWARQNNALGNRICQNISGKDEPTSSGGDNEYRYNYQ